jgi:rhodanese-related sulfurtransferase
MTPRTSLALVLALSLFSAACGDDDGATATATRIETVAASRAAEIIDGAPEGLVVLDIRTPEEFAAGHIAGAVNVDYYEANFRDQLDTLDKGAPYVMYCRSGNRSSDARGIMEELGFQEVYELDGGVLSWDQAGYSLTTQ